MKRIGLFLIGAMMISIIPAVQADWNEGDPFKMHYPQLPDPTGWDVAFNGKTLADDFMCTESGEITEVHFWVSWNNDFIDWDSINNIHLSIHTDIPDPDGPGPEYSMPGELLWETDVNQGGFIYRPYGEGAQGWYDPETGEWEENNHTQIHQINITGIQNAFVQTQGEIYWLDIRIDQNPTTAEIGWKTTQDHWNDDSVWDEFGVWQELFDPRPGHENESLDQAFVVVPEPNAIVMILISGSGFIFIRRKFMM